MSKEFHYASFGKCLPNARSEVGNEEANTSVLIKGTPYNVKKRNTGWSFTLCSCNNSPKICAALSKKEMSKKEDG